MKLIFMLFLLLSASTFTTSSHTSYIYPQTARITHLDYETDTVTITTATNISYSFEGVEDYELGDLVSVIMNSNHTKDYILDDTIIKVQYSGFKTTN